MKVFVAKNRVQPANSLQAKYFVSRAMTEANWWQSPFSLLHDFLPRAASPLFYPRGEAKCVKSPSVQGARRSAPSGTACRAPTFLNPTLSTASKRNEVMAPVITCFDRRVAKKGAGFVAAFFPA